MSELSTFDEGFVLGDQTIFTTGQAAKVMGVTPRQVSKWFDSGRLRGYRIPGNQDRRIPKENLLQFMKEHGITMKPEVSRQPDPYLIGQAYAGLALIRDTANSTSRLVGQTLEQRDVDECDRIATMADKLIERLMSKSDKLRKFLKET